MGPHAAATDVLLSMDMCLGTQMSVKANLQGISFDNVGYT